MIEYKSLKCDKCGAKLDGRHPSEGGLIYCPKCLADDELDLVSDTEEAPPEVLSEMKNGRG